MNKKIEIKKFASFFIIMAGICWGMIGIFSSNLSDSGCSAIDITFLRSGVTAISLLTYIVLVDKSKLRIYLKDIWMFIGTGVLSIVFFNTMYFITIKLTSLSMAAILLYTAPSFVMIMSVIIFHERITKRKIVSLLIAFFGCICTTGIIDGIFSGQGLGSISFFGVLTGIVSGICYALYSIFGNIALKKYNSLTVTAYTFFVATITLIPFCFNSNLGKILIEGNVIIDVFSIGLLSTLLPFILYTIGLRDTEPSRASVMAFVEPMVATLIGVFMFNEKITICSSIGIALIFISLVILNIKSKLIKLN